jgi:5-methylcytosine-specific restriction endonuclease McrA
MCSRHYNRWRRTGNPLLTLTEITRQPPLCKVEGCDKARHAWGYCPMHLYRWRLTGSPGDAVPTLQSRDGVCRIEDCGRPIHGDRLCKRHHLRKMRHGDPLAGKSFQRPNDGCLVEKCNGVHYAHGYCRKHYRSSLPGPRYRPPGNTHNGQCTPEQLAARIAYYGGRCWLCGGESADTIDHVKPRSAGGPDWPSNLRPAHRRCNSKKRAKWPFDLPSIQKVA